MSYLKTARINAEFSIEQAAKHLGISAGYLSQIENGRRQVSKERVTEIAILYGTNRDEIFLPSRYAVRKVNGSTTA
ncbi:Helix-turn-helix [Evansella caseinilytica]|uniref:Helix-turn-helix n=1 Tax=Evansella caseinilytica TaxID=1503961 RepID=A0A1H3V3Y4_9BACI|nr:helix-turn-helix transcriptional regulator [Evansella caseinilytica]SDZ68779.1 Helix-turn-helix [Evansella caseinilytica]